MKVERVISLKKRASEIIRELNLNHEPILITARGKPAACLIDVQSFQEIARRTALLEGLASGEAALKEGRVVPQEEAKRRMSKWPG